MHLGATSWHLVKLSNANLSELLLLLKPAIGEAETQSRWLIYRRQSCLVISGPMKLSKTP